MGSSAGYYHVKVTVQDRTYTHTVYAASDYAAAVKVRQATGFMPASDHDVTYVHHHPMTMISPRACG